MNHKARRLLSLLLAICFALGLLPGFSFAAEKTPAPAEASAAEPPAPAEAPFYGYRATPRAGTRALTDAYLRGEGERVNWFRPGEPVRDLPASYDSRDYGWVTSVKNQNPYGSCWAHAAMASIESYMISHAVPVGTGAAATTNLNLSETQHCFFNYSYAYDAEGMLTGDKSTPSESCLDQGGNGEMSAYTLMRWTGAADESVSALAYSNASTVNYSGLDSQYAYANNVSHVQNTVWIPGTNVDAVKQAIMEYGAGNISYYETGSAYTYICTIDNTSQDSSSHKWANHAITVVGWDDSIAASKFSPNKPSKPGAWICKNSWGTGYFQNGYCYISYEDTTMNEGYIYFYDAEPIDNYQHNYQYDGSCNPVCYGKGWNTSVNYYLGFANDTKVANVFTAKGAETLQAISFCNWDEDLTYTVEIFKNPVEGDPSSGTLMATETGSLPFPGYFTIPLTEAIPLAAGESFSVVITQSCPVADGNGAYIHTPYDASFNNSSVVSWCSWIHADHGATSYYKEPNGAWTDCPENGDYRIKAYTDDIQYNVEAVANNPAWGSLSVNGTRITAEPIEGYYVAGYEVVSGTATAVININVINVAPSSDCVIRVIFAPKPTFSVSFLASGTLEGQLTARIYDVITLPASIGLELEDWSFSGWTETQLTEETADKPVIYLPGADFMVTKDTVLYAVFTRVEGSTELVYRIVTGEPEDWAGNYVITYGSTESLEALRAISGGSSYEASGNGSAVAYASTGMTLDDSCLHDAADAFIWQIAARGSGYTIQNKSNSTYLGCSGTYLTSIASYSEAKCSWTIAYDLYKGATRASNTEGGSNTQYPYFSHSTQGSYFVMNSESGYSQCPPQFWRETTLSTTYYCTEPIVGEHDHDLVYVAPVDATCVLNGNLAYWRCTICGRCFSDADGENEIPASSVVIPAKGHTPGEPQIENETVPSCGDDGGYDTVICCTVCGETISVEHTVIPATGAHELGAWSSNEDGTHSRSCSVCSYVETEDCAYTDTVTPPTPADQGFTTHTCTVCGYSYDDSFIPCLGYDYTIHFSVPEGVEQPADLVSNTNTGVTLPVVVAPEGYSFLGWVETDYDNVQTAPASILTGHYTAASDLTLKALFVYYVGGEFLFSLLSQAPADWSGRYVISYQADASYVLKGLVAGSSYEVKTSGSAVALADTGMDLEGNTLKNVTEPYIFVLRPQDSAWGIRSLEAGSWLTVVNKTLKAAADCDGNSLWTLALSADGVASLKNLAAPESYSVLSFTTGSSLGTFFRVRGAADNIRLWKEVNTGTAYYTTVLSDQPCQHVPGEPVEENRTEPSCTEAGGFDSVVFCTLCGAELSREHVVLEALGHAPGEPAEENRVEPNCTEAGAFDTVIRCTRCSQLLESTHTELPALGHDYAVTVTEPGCMEPGSRVYTCSRCGDSYTETVEPLGHDYAVTVTEPGCTEPGSRVYTCSRCGDSYTETVEPLGHDYVDGKCSRCGKWDPAMNPFEDVSEGKYYYEPVLWAYYHDPQITGGTDATHFSPNKTCTREQIVTFLWKAKGAPEPVNTENPFTDVKEGKYYYKAVLWAVENKITGGVSADKFGVGKPCTREQAMSFLWKACGSPEPVSTENPFTDVKEGKYYYKAVLWAVENKITGGASADKFGVGKPCTRAQIVTFLYKALGD